MADRSPISSSRIQENIEKIGIQCDSKGRVKVNEKFKTNINNIYAVGDVKDGPMLAHKAEEEGIAVAEIIAGQAGHVLSLIHI